MQEIHQNSLAQKIKDFRVLENGNNEHLNILNNVSIYDMPGNFESSIDEMFPYIFEDAVSLWNLIYERPDKKKIEQSVPKKDENGKEISFLESALREFKKGRFEIKTLKSYKFYSAAAAEAIDYIFIQNGRFEKSYLEDKIVNFFKSYEWETWAWKYAESILDSDSSPYMAQKKSSQVSGNTVSPQRLK